MRLITGFGGDHILEIRQLSTHFTTTFGEVRAVDRVSLNLARDEIVGLVGASGCGKTAFALSLLRLVPAPGRIVSGNVLFEGADLLALSEAAMCRVRGRRIAIVMQNSLTALHPAYSVGKQIADVVRRNRGLQRGAASAVAHESLEMVGILPAARWAAAQPHQLSGGMQQRVLLAMALSCEPALMLADEPTTGLDLSVQADILRVLKERCSQTGMAVIFITHDLKVLAGMADRIAVMYAGQVVEDAERNSLLRDPRHPYTAVLVAAALRLEGSLPLAPNADVESATSVSHVGCVFAPLCPRVFDRCGQARPDLSEVAPGWRVACFLYHDRSVSDSSLLPVGEERPS